MTDVDVILDILKALLVTKPESVFVNSLYQQYCNRGGLSKKQLEGLHSKATKTAGISAGKLATLEAIIKKKPTRYKSEINIQPKAPAPDENLGKIMTAILAKYPLHKRIIFLQSKFENNDALSALEQSEIEKFGKLLL